MKFNGLERDIINWYINDAGDENIRTARNRRAADLPSGKRLDQQR
jgi:hypothetical protein